MDNLLPLLLVPLAMVLIGVRCMRCGHKQLRDRCEEERHS